MRSVAWASAITLDSTSVIALDKSLEDDCNLLDRGFRGKRQMAQSLSAILSAVQPSAIMVCLAAV